MNSRPLLTVDQALAQLLDAAQALPGTETVSTFEADGRVLARDVISPIDVPSMRNTQMDGYAVRASELVRASDAAPVRLKISQRIPAGHVGTPLEPATAARIFTGAMIPDGADAVVMQEQTKVDGEHAWFRHAPAIDEWIRPVGEDIARGTTILNAGLRLTPQSVGLAASIGCQELEVHRRVRVATIFTGDELAMPGEPLRPGAIYNSNRFVLRAMVQRLGCELTDIGHVRDDRAATIEALREAARSNDLIVTSGGVSVGEEDHVKPAVEAIGRLDMWQIAIKPGKPLAFGQVATTADRDARQAWFIGLPGNPVSSFVTFALFVRPFLLKLAGVTDVTPRRVSMRADFDWPRPDRRQEYLRARINGKGGLDLYPSQSSSVLTSTVWGDGLIENPAAKPIARGDLVQFIAFESVL